MKKISSWESIPRNERKTKKVKKYKGKEGCYFTKEDTESYVWEEEPDYSDISRDEQTHWKKGQNIFNEPKQSTSDPVEHAYHPQQVQTPKKSKWRFW